VTPAVGKGAERHAGGQPFDAQPMQSISDLFDSPYGMAFQVTKKLHEGLKKLNVSPQINFLPEDFDDFTNNGLSAS
jgi:hypothetical protein